MTGPSRCQRHAISSEENSPAAGSWIAHAPVLRSHRRRPSRSRPFSGSFPARRLIDLAPRRWSPRAGRDRNPWGLTFDDEESGDR